LKGTKGRAKHPKKVEPKTLSLVLRREAASFSGSCVHLENKMVKTDRPNAPLGLALLFFSLAVVPASLKMAG
jgi:hypothetical protein